MRGWTKALGLMTVLAVATAWVTARAQQGDAKTGGEPERVKSLPKCPVMPEDDVDFLISSPTETGPVFFCCKGCIEDFAKEPRKYEKAVSAQREALSKRPRIQVTCPISGEPVDPTKFVERGGQRVYFCCARCAGKFEAEPTKYQAKLAASYTYQTQCPVDKAAIDPNVSVQIAGGHKVYFDRVACTDAFKKHPGEYLANLAAQGITIKASDVLPASGSGNGKAETQPGDGH